MEDLQRDVPVVSGVGISPEKEGQLGHLLQLERERRIQVEQQVESQKQLCLELHRLLSQERRLRNNDGSCPAQFTLPLAPPLTPPFIDKTVASDSGGIGTAMPGDRTRADGSDTRVPTASQTQNGVGTPSNIGADPPGDGALTVDFSSTVFDQLSSDLQEILGVKDDTDESAPGNVPYQTTLNRAMDTVRANDPLSLQRCLEHLERTRRARETEWEEKIGLKFLAAASPAQDADVQSLLDAASEMGRTACVRVLLAAGCTPDACVREDGMTPLHLAAINGHVGSLRLLVEWGGQASPQDSQGETPLFLALCEGHCQYIDVLLEAGSSLQVVTTSGYTVLHAAVSGNLPDTLRTLLVHLRTSLGHSEVYCVVNHRNQDGNTALHLAVSRGYKRCAEVLCASPDVDLTLRDRWNRTALDISTEDCRELLLNKESKEVTVCIDTNGSKLQTDSLLPSSVAIGKITILRHHKWSDVELLVEETMRQYCHYLKGHGSLKLPASSRVSLRNQSESSDDEPSGGSRDSSPLSEAIKRELSRSQEGRDLEKLLGDARRELSQMDLTAASIASFRIGQTCWRPGELPLNLRSKNLFGVLAEGRNSITRIGIGRSSKTLDVHISLKGSSEGCLDRLAFELMIPVATLKECVELLESQRLLMLHGVQGSGKTLLAKSLAEHLKYRLGVERTQVVHAPLHPSFKRDDLFRLLHLNGLLVPVENYQAASESRSSQYPQSYILLLDDMDKVSALEHGASEVLAELLSLLEHPGHTHPVPGHTHPVWVAGVHSRDGELLYPPGHYCLRENCYVIATKTCASSKALEPAVASRFPHLTLGLGGEPCSGALHRQLMARVLHAKQGAIPHRSDELYRAVQWVWEVWLLYNHFLLRLDLPELTIGMRHFIQCPVEADPEGVCSWLCKVWNTHLAPWIEDTLLSSKQTEGSHRHDTTGSLLTAVVHKVFRVTCPLGPEGTARLLQRLRGGPGDVTSSRDKKKKGKRGAPPPLQTVASYPSPPPHSARSVSPGTPSGSLVAFEELARNSQKARKSKKAPIRASVSMDQINNKSSSVGGTKLRESGGKMGALKKLRSKTLSLFSQDSGGTLPRLFRRGSRTSLASVAEEDISLTMPDEKNTSQDLDSFFDMLSLANSDRLNDQRSPVPFSPAETGRHPAPPPHSNPTPLPKYVLPTSSPKGTSPLLHSSGINPVHSMPDLSLAEGRPSPLSRPRHDIVGTGVISISVDVQQGSDTSSEASCKRDTPDGPCATNEDDSHSLVWRQGAETEILPFEPKSEPLQRRTFTPLGEQRESSSTHATPETIKKDSRLSYERTPTHSCSNGTTEDPTPKKLFLAPERAPFDEEHMRASSTEALLSEHRDTTATPQGLFRTISDGRLRRRSAFRRDECWSQHARASVQQRRNSKTKIGIVRENGFEISPETETPDRDSWMFSGGRDLEESGSCERLSDTSSVRSASLLFSASLGFCSHDSPILKTASLHPPPRPPSKDSPRLSNPRPSIALMDLFTDESIAEM